MEKLAVINGVDVELEVANDFKTFKNYALKLEKMLKDLKDDENKENKLLLRMQNDFLECLELYKSVNI
ncbi:hypothetical protein E5921_09410 [Campylobacter coli]|nr:hypothetical protein [Campylobacter coli]EAL3511064.1 hypothetical protein [Campylobacter coli]ECL9251074.1 hypothetical protein [Campylobacter coli]ECO2084618.1 hypothetical protein [Campylobacter coli]ECQ0773084.1 hypothetical protein [Campylobacter coli]